MTAAEPIVVAGTGALCHLGIGAGALRDLGRGAPSDSGFRAVPPFTLQDYVTLRTPCFDPVAEMTVAAVALALGESRWAGRPGEPTRCGLVLGTAYGSVGALRRYLQAARPSPLQFVHTFMNAAAGLACEAFRLRGAHALLCSGTLAGLQALRYGMLLLRTGKADRMLCGGVDSLRTWAECDPPGAARAALGEGAGLLALCRATEADGSALAELAGWGSATAAGPEPAPFDRALASALAEAGISGAELSAVVLATGAGEPGAEAERRALTALAVGEERWIDLKPSLGDTGAAHAALGAVLACSLASHGRGGRVAIDGYQDGRCATLLCAPARNAEAFS